MFYSCASRLHSRGAVVGSIKKALLAPSPTACKKIQVATLKATYGDKYPYAKPYPYKERPVNTLVSAYEKTIHRLNENSKVLILSKIAHLEFKLSNYCFNVFRLSLLKGTLALVKGILQNVCRWDLIYIMWNRCQKLIVSQPIRIDLTSDH